MAKKRVTIHEVMRKVARGECLTALEREVLARHHKKRHHKHHHKKHHKRR